MPLLDAEGQGGKMSIGGVGHHDHDQIRLKLDLRIRDAESSEPVPLPADAGTGTVGEDDASKGVEDLRHGGELELSLRARSHGDDGLRIRLKLEAEFEGGAAGRTLEELKLRIEIRFQSPSAVSALGALGEEGNRLSFTALNAFGSVLSAIAGSLGQSHEGEESGPSVLEGVQAAFAELSSVLRSIFGLSDNPQLASGELQAGSPPESDPVPTALAPPLIDTLPAVSEDTESPVVGHAADVSSPAQSLADSLHSFLADLRSTFESSLEQLRTLLEDAGARRGFRIDHGEGSHGARVRYEIHVHGSTPDSDDASQPGVDLQA